MARYGDSITWEKKIQGQTVKIHCTSDGDFSATVQGETYKGLTMSAVVSAVRTALKKTRITVSVPAMLLGFQVYTNGNHFQRKYVKTTAKPIIFTGLDPRDGEVQWKFADGTASDKRRDRMRSQKFAKKMTAEQVTQYERLYAEESRAREALQKFVEKFELDWKEPDRMVKEAIAAKIDTPNESDLEDEDGDPR